MDVGAGKSRPCSWCWACRGPQMDSHLCRVGPAHERSREPAAAGRGARQEVHPTIIEWRRTSAPFLSRFLHATSYGHLGKVEGRQFPWERCGSLAAYTQCWRTWRTAAKKGGHQFERWGLCSSQKSSRGSAKADIRTTSEWQSSSNGRTLCRRPVFEPDCCTSAESFHLSLP